MGWPVWTLLSNLEALLRITALVGMPWKPTLLMNQLSNRNTNVGARALVLILHCFLPASDLGPKAAINLTHGLGIPSRLSTPHGGK